jgi:1-acyl-sn-glycerol-3-phosphate acyltransferase
VLYFVLRWMGGVGLRWYYRDLRAVGLDRVPADAPVLLAVNHPNALVDALVAGCAVRRRITLTAKATLFDNPAFAAIAGRVGIVPLRRASDEARKARSADGARPRGREAPPSGTPDAASPSRNADSFRALLDALAERRAVLIFPEGKSHNEPRLAPLKTGLARIALQARDDRGVRGLQVVPLGITFERKWAPRTRVLVQAGEPIELDAWRPSTASARSPAEQLTALLDERLQEVTLNFDSTEDAERVLAASETLAGVFDDVRPLGAPDTPLENVVSVSRRVDAVRRTLAARATHEPVLAARVAEFERRLHALRAALDEAGIAPNDLQLDTGLTPAGWFVVREAAIAAVAGPLALWGRVNHWLPLRIARFLALRASRTPEDPAMNTLVIGLGVVLLFYALQTTAVALAFGGWWALAYALTLVPSATWDFRYSDRTRRASQRVRTYLRFRRTPELRLRLLGELAWLREEAAAIERACSVDTGDERPAAGARA